MRRHKKLIIAAVLACILLLGSLGSMALANDGDNDSAAEFGEFMDKVISNYEGEGYTIESPEALKQAFYDAKTEMREAKDRLQGLTDEQKAALQEWRDSRPGLTDEQKAALQEWCDSRPEDLPKKFSGRMHGGFRGFASPCAPAE